MTLNADYPVVYRNSKITGEYTFEINIMAKDEKTLNEVMERILRKGDVE